MHGRVPVRLRTAHAEIPWGLISGLRHHLVHDYDDTNWDIVATVIFDELPVLIQQIEKLREPEFKE